MTDESAWSFAQCYWVENDIDVEQTEGPVNFWDILKRFQPPVTCSRKEKMGGTEAAGL